MTQNLNVSSRPQISSTKFSKNGKTHNQGQKSENYCKNIVSQAILQNFKHEELKQDPNYHSESSDRVEGQSKVLKSKRPNNKKEEKKMEKWSSRQRRRLSKKSDQLYRRRNRYRTLIEIREQNLIPEDILSKIAKIENYCCMHRKNFKESIKRVDKILEELEDLLVLQENDRKDS